MEITSLIIFGFLVRVIVAAIRDREPQVQTITPKRESICLYCVHAHIARGYSAKQELTYCSYAGTARELKFAVSDCSMFCHRNAKAAIVRVVGFADTQIDRSPIPSIAAQVE